MNYIIHSKYLTIFHAFAFFSHNLGVDSANACIARDYGKGSVVCVCNATYCDTFEQIESSKSQEIVTMFESAKSGKRLAKTTYNFINSIDNKTGHGQMEYSNRTGWKKVTLDHNVKYQKIIGFGGSFTDSAGINILSLASPMPERIISEYFSPDGLAYNMARLPIGNTDFSIRGYDNDQSKDDDFAFTKFRLVEEDYKYRIALIELANRTGTHLKLFASPWTAPDWMKTNKNSSGERAQKWLKGEPGDGQYYRAWANLFVKILDAYKKEGVTMWGITIANEPYYAVVDDHYSVALTPTLMRDFIKLDLGPTLKSGGYGIDVLELMIFDDKRKFIKMYTDVILVDSEAAKYFSGVAFHWYENEDAQLPTLDSIHYEHPKLFLLSTEACEGPWGQEKVSLGDWKRAENYAHDILTNLQHFVGGWVDWNLALDVQGGPNLNGPKGFVDSPIIINATGEEYYRQPMFYAMAHFSKFLPADSVRIHIKEEGNANLQTVAFQTPENRTVLIALNSEDDEIEFELSDPLKKGVIKTVVPAHSIQTYVWNN